MNLKSVVTLGGAIDGSFGKIGAAFDESITNASKNVKSLEQEQRELSRTISKTEKSIKNLAKVEQDQAAALVVLQQQETARSEVVKSIRSQRTELRKLAEERDKQAESESEALEDTNAKYAALEKSLNDQIDQREKLSGEIKKGQKAQKKFADDSKKLKDSIQDVDELENSYKGLEKGIEKARIEAEGFEKASKLGKTLKGVGKASAVAIGSVWATTTAVAGLMTMTNSHTAEVVGMAQAYDMSIEKFQAWGGIAKQAGLEADSVGDLVEELRNKFGEFQALGEQSTVSDVFGALGIEAAALEGLNSAEQFEFMIERLEGVQDKAQAASLADMLMGGEGNKLVTYMRNTGMSMNELLNEQERFNNLTDVGASGAKKYGDSFGFLQTSIVSSWAEISGIVGGEMAGEMKTLGETVSHYVRANKTELVSTLKTLITGAKNFAVALWDIGSSINSVVQIMGGWKTIGIAVAAMVGVKLVVGLAGLVTGLLSVGKAIGFSKIAMAGFNLVMTANPIGLVVAAVGALVMAGVTLYRNWDEVANWFSVKLDWFKTEFPATFNFIKTVFDWSPLGLIINNWGAITGFFDELWQGVLGKFDFAINKIKSAVDTVGSFASKLKFWGDDDDEAESDKPLHVQKRSQSGRFGRNIQQAVESSNRAQNVIGRAKAAHKNTIHQKVEKIEVIASPGQSPQEVGQAVFSALSGHQNSALYDLPE